MLRFCPNCGENLAQYKPSARAKVIQQPAYDQTRIWKELVALAESHRASPPAPEALILPVLERSAEVFADGKEVRSVIHLVLDRSIVPQGGVLQRAALSEGRLPTTTEQLELAGYVLEEGKVQMVDDIPIGIGYQIVNYWGGERQHKRWHLAKPVSINPSRNGNPYFMDDNLVAFGAKWLDGERTQEALFTLLELFAHGINDSGTVATPLALAVFWQGSNSGIRKTEPEF